MSIRFFIVGAVALTLGACASAPQTAAPQNGGGQAFDLSAPLPGADSAEQPTFLTSASPAKGNPWTQMRPHGFTGGLTEACELMGLTPDQCRTAATNHSEGRCKTVDFREANGKMVLDALTFTRGGNHRAQKNVLVNLTNPPSWMMDVCDAGDGVFIIRFHGCDNFAVIRTNGTAVATTVAAATTPAPAVASATCQGGRFTGRLLSKDEAAQFRAKADVNHSASKRYIPSFRLPYNCLVRTPDDHYVLGGGGRSVNGFSVDRWRRPAADVERLGLS